MTSFPPSPSSDNDLQPQLREKVEAARRAEVNLEQRQADVELVTRAALAGFAGPEWNEIVGELAAYGWGVAFGWLRRGQVESRCRRANRMCPAFDPRTRESQWAESLATDVMVEAIIRFRDEVLIPGRWDASKGTTLKTFFVGQILKRFPNEYRKWYRNELRPYLRTDAELETDQPAPGSVAGQALDRVEVEEALARCSPRTRMIVELHAADRPHDEIAAELGMTLAAVDSALYRFRNSHVA